MSTGDYDPPDLEAALTLVGRGWWPLLERLYAEVDATPSQIKEKFVGLRVYFYPEDVDRLGLRQTIDYAGKLERESFTICEACGARGERRDTKWQKTLCDRHYEMRRAGQPWKAIFGFLPYTTPREGIDG